MLDSEIKRAVLQDLMDQLDGVDRDGMRDRLFDHDTPQTELPEHTPEDMPEIMSDVKKDKEPDEDDLPSIDPIVMLAKRFHK